VCGSGGAGKAVMQQPSSCNAQSTLTRPLTHQTTPPCESKPPTQGEAISKLGLVLSRFEFNKMPNPLYHPGAFELHIGGGFSAYRNPRPQLVVFSSAGVERNAIIGDDAGE